MLTKEQLTTINLPPKIDEISLQLLQEFYEAYICPYTYIYVLNNNVTIKLNLYEADFCHLLGLQYITSNNKKVQVIKGQKGYDKIKNNLITFQTLKSLNKQGFIDIRSRIKYFPFIYQLLRTPSALKFDKACLGKCKIDCEFLFYDDFNNSIIHLGIEQGKNSFYSKTFLVEPKMGDKFIKGQQQLDIQQINIVAKSIQHQVAATKENLDENLR